MGNFNLDNRKFTALFNSSHGQVNQETIFNYHQEGLIIWAHYGGGEIKIGTLCGQFTSENTLHFKYGHWDKSGVYRSGTCDSVLSLLDDDRIRIHEKWTWDDEDFIGESVLTEVA